MVKESSFGLIRALIMETSSKTTFMVKESIVGLMAVSTTVNGSITRWKAKVPSLGVTEEDMKETTRMIKSTGMVHLSGQMVGSTLVTGAKVNNMERESISKRARRDKESGRWARELSGSRTQEAQLTSE